METLKRENSPPVFVRTATSEDTEKLIKLNQKWQKTALDGNIKDGYVGAAFSRDTFEKLISQSQIVIAHHAGNIVGYYLLNNISSDGVIGKHQGFVNDLKSIGRIDPISKVCVGAQAVVDTDYMGSGIRQLMLNQLIVNMTNKHDYLFATIAKDNPRAFKAHTRDGWYVVGENEALFFVLFELPIPAHS